jgi:hypothetical protein
MTEKIGIINYMATGEGHTLGIFVHYNKSEIKDIMGDYFTQGLTLVDAIEVRDAPVLDKGARYSEDDPVYIKHLLSVYAPAFLSALDSGVYVKSYMRHHMNAS